MTSKFYGPYGYGTNNSHIGGVFDGFDFGQLGLADGFHISRGCGLA